MEKSTLYRVVAFILLAWGTGHAAAAQQRADEALLKKVDEQVRKEMEDGDIPGLSLVIIRGDQQIIRSYGYADLARRKPVTAATLFEIGSCSKAFTALAAASLVRQGKLKLDASVAEYLPWFSVRYKDKKVSITVRQLLHHTSGIPWSTLSKIPQTGRADALEQTVRKLVGQKLKKMPGKKYEYATINYDVVALIIETIARRPFETYLRENVIDPLKLSSTTIGRPRDPAVMATGYKIGFFSPRAYKAPVFKGNNAAGYVVSNAEDMARWLRFQMGSGDAGLYPLAGLTHQRDGTVPLHGMTSYAMGWEVSLSGNGEINHGGLNPNYTAYVAFRPGSKLGIAVLANSNSTFTPVVADKTMRLLAGEEPDKEFNPGDRDDTTFSIVACILGAYILIVLASLVMLARGIISKRRKYEPFTYPKLGKLVLSLLMILPFLFGIYTLPNVVYGFSWSSIIVWTPISFLATLVLLVVALGVSGVAFLASSCFPEGNQMKRVAPQMILVSILASLANMLVIILITSSLDSEVESGYQVFYYGLTLSVYLLGKRYVQINLIKLSRNFTYELKIKLLDKIFATSYQKFEQVDRGRVYTALNDDVDTIGNGANTFVVLVTSLCTAIGSFMYLASISFWATLMTLFIVVSLTTLYYLVVRSTNAYYEEARDTRNTFMTLINNLMEGFKEISLHGNKKQEYKADVAASANAYRTKIAIANTRFVNASLVGETIFVLLLGAVAFAFPQIFPGIKTYTLMSFVIVLLYLTGPVNTIIGAVPAVMGLRIAWHRLQSFMKEVPADAGLRNAVRVAVPATVDTLRMEGVQFSYKGGNEQHGFGVGPIDLEVHKGEILFIIGGNGSGKTTLAKLLTGLYEASAGTFRINGQTVKASQLGEYYSAVFSPAYLFEKLYDTDVTARPEEVASYLKLLDLDQKVEIKGNRYSTIDLSGGQRKRLALLQCYLEDSPVYLFDEWAADQDPGYRNFFYRTLLPQMREKGKIVIAVTHDDHYFDVADRIFRMNHGRLERYSSEMLLASAEASGGTC